MLNPEAAQAAITEISMTSEMKNADMVYFVGRAARFTTKTETIPSITMESRKKLIPDITTTKKANGVITHP
jgi:hypothetical protein